MRPPIVQMRNLWPLGAAILMGFALLPPIEHEYQAWAAQRAMESELSRPVVKMTGQLLERGTDDVLLRIEGEKIRPCKYAGILAFSLDVTGQRHAANIARVAPIAQTNKTLPVGSYDFGTWRVWPVDSRAAVILVYVEHVCSAVVVQTLAAEVRL